MKCRTLQGAGGMAFEHERRRKESKNDEREIPDKKEWWVLSRQVGGGGGGGWDPTLDKPDIVHSNRTLTRGNGEHKENSNEINSLSVLNILLTFDTLQRSTMLRFASISIKGKFRFWYESSLLYLEKGSLPLVDVVHVGLNQSLLLNAAQMHVQIKHS